MQNQSIRCCATARKPSTGDTEARGSKFEASSGLKKIQKTFRLQNENWWSKKETKAKEINGVSQAHAKQANGRKKIQQ